MAKIDLNESDQLACVVKLGQRVTHLLLHIYTPSHIFWDMYDDDDTVLSTESDLLLTNILIEFAFIFNFR